MFANNNMLLMLYGKSDALGDVTATTANLRWCGNRWGLRCGRRCNYGCRQGYDRGSATYGRDDPLACRRRKFNQFAQQQCIVRLTVWDDAGVVIVLRDVRLDLGSRRCFVGESFRLRTLIIRNRPLLREFVRASMRAYPVSEVFPSLGRQAGSFRHEIAASRKLIP
jgi:hypothetical protein